MFRRLVHGRTRSTSAAFPLANQDHLSDVLTLTQPPRDSTPPESESMSQHDGSNMVSGSTTRVDTADPWSAAYEEAVAQLDEEMHALVSRGRDLVELFDNLNESNDMQKSHSIIRRGLERLQTPIKYMNVALTIASPLASANPIASTAIGIVQSVTTVSESIYTPEE